ncbi:MAG: conjugal transfer protein TraX [Anaerosolibacter sp.]|uniref:TraX family protein n=1 Tax=Anaerosolibacter sp. TaxID=1872527 RepID=UPI002639F37E|nr:TraX family protein [Anaerosolibacter sp.]MDF2547548.1 conjugal transfer protein TraX [Anaerosolibacter sp.]
MDATHQHEKNDVLKLLAIISMLIDHIGYGLFPKVMVLRYIGRLAFPIFAYHIAIGCRYTKDLHRYILRLFSFALISQIPYTIYFRPSPNIFFSLAFGVMVIQAYKENKPWLALLVAFIAHFSGASYGIYGLMLMLFFYIHQDNLQKAILPIILITLTYCAVPRYGFQIFSLFALIPICHPWNIRLHINKYIFYWFYPAHILLLWFIKQGLT